MEWGTLLPGNIFGAAIQPHPKSLYRNQGENLASCKNQFKCLQRNSKAWHCRLIFTRWVTETVDLTANLWAKARWPLLLAWEWLQTCFLEPWRQSEPRVAFCHLLVRLPLQGASSQLRDVGLAGALFEVTDWPDPLPTPHTMQLSLVESTVCSPKITFSGW